MKLTKNKLIELIRRKNDGWTSYRIKKTIGVSIRRIDQIWTEYKQTGKIPEIGKRFGRPKRPILKEEEQVVSKAYEKYRICASRLKKFIEKDFSISIPHYHIHKIMLKLSLAKTNERDDVRKKKWIRYERRHSLTAVHIDWHYDDKTRKWVLPVLDDSSRKLLAMVEVESATTDASIDAMEEALKHGEIEQCISDHGAQFTSNERGESRFKDFLDSKGIKQILCKIKHPQSNGKLEKFNDLYINHRHAFKTKEKFMHWYNNVKPHMSLDERTPEEAYQERKKKGRKYYT